MSVKEVVKSLQHSKFAVGRVTYYFAKKVRLVAAFACNARYRWEYISANILSGYQRSTFTKVSRYPVVFQKCRDFLYSTSSPKIMSFGCSTGEEVLTLLHYIPNATIVGVDINSWCLKKAQQAIKSDQCRFIHRTSTAFEEADGFDAIFCMAVFQRTENRTSKDNSQAQGFLFENFEKEVLVLDKKLKKGGLLVIDNADFSFNDTSISEKYSPLAFEGNRIERKRPLFDRNNQKVAESHFSFRVFVKYSE